MLKIGKIMFFDFSSFFGSWDFYPLLNEIYDFSFNPSYSQQYFECYAKNRIQKY